MHSGILVILVIQRHLIFFAVSLLKVAIDAMPTIHLFYITTNCCSVFFLVASRCLPSSWGVYLTQDADCMIETPIFRQSLQNSGAQQAAAENKTQPRIPFLSSMTVFEI